MPCAYIGKAKVVIPTISKDIPVPCILVDVTTYSGPLFVGQSGKSHTERTAIPIGQLGVQRHKVVATGFHPVTGEYLSDTHRGCSGFNDAIGKRVSWTKTPIRMEV